MLPSWQIFEIVLGQQGSAHFVCVAETTGNVSDPQRTLDGKIFIISEPGRWHCIVNAEVRHAQAALNGFEAARGIPIDHALGPGISTLQATCATNCAFQCSFSLQRNGTIDICVDSTDRRCSEAPTYPSGYLLDNVAGQMYSFLRDVGHKHQHHPASTDTIIDLHRYENDDITWWLNTLYSIYRRIISYKRQDDITVQIRCIGLLAYANAFKKAWLEDRPDAADTPEIPIYYDDEMKGSIQASEVRMRFKNQQREQIWSAMRTVTFSVLGLIVSFTAIIRLSNTSAAHIQTPPAGDLIWLSKNLLTYPGDSVVLVGTPLVIVTLLTSSIHFRPDEWKAYRVVQALLQPFGRKRTTSLYVVGALGMLAIAAGLLFA